jgi:hypothetical protein
MKLTVAECDPPIGEPEPEFAPVKIEITVENMAELVSLWGRMNIGWGLLTDSKTKAFSKYTWLVNDGDDEAVSYPIWRETDKILVARTKD